MIGRGADGFNVAIHRMASQLRSQIELVGVVFSSDSEKYECFGESLFVPIQGVYISFQEMTGKKSKSGQALKKLTDGAREGGSFRK
jgi:hypothetical protein